MGHVPCSCGATFSLLTSNKTAVMRLDHMLSSPANVAVLPSVQDLCHLKRSVQAGLRFESFDPLSLLSERFVVRNHLARTGLTLKVAFNVQAWIKPEGSHERPQRLI